MTTESFSLLSRALRKKVAWNDTEALAVDGLDVDVYKLLYHSQNSRHLVGASAYHCQEHDVTFSSECDGGPSDCDIESNNHFRYPLIRERRIGGALPRHRRAIILLHGLNEGSFSKYIPWAHQLWAKTGTPIILFPLTFHMNRVLPAWASLQTEIFQRRSALAENDSAHRYNAIISERLDTHPARFFWGAVQTYLDLVDLAREIRAGRHPHFAPDARVDLVGYSAGGYFTLFLLMDDRERLFSDSRGVVFASGIPIRELDLASPLILDLTAEVALMKLFVKNVDPPASARMQHWFEHHGEGRWMRTFCGSKHTREKLERRFRESAPRLMGIANTNDEVVPVGSMLNMLQGVKRDTGVQVLELEMGVHENPFSAPSYEKGRPGRKLITEFFDEALYGKVFHQFIDAIANHLSQPSG
jgi:pimeloyl-ACP methyl ester carboxylesterase